MSRQRFMFILGALGAAVALSAVSASASAQQRSSPVRPPSVSAPSGSYQQTCRGITMNGAMLSAQCPNRSGAPVFSSIDSNSCRGRDIHNDNGYLRCNAPGPVPPTPPVPTGSYQQTCRGITMNGATLSAQCPNSRGAPVFSSLDTNSCRGRDIRNDNGYLRCSAPGPVPPTPSIPTGSYQESCRGITVNGNTLRAQCTNEQGRPVASSLDLNGCRNKEIYNDNGYLRCGAAVPVPPTPPPGGGSFEAIAYTSANYGGRQLRIHEPIANLANFPGFNDNIRSIRIIRGRAEVCTDARYRGQCRTINQSIGDLNRIGMGNRISSIR